MVTTRRNINDDPQDGTWSCASMMRVNLAINGAAACYRILGRQILVTIFMTIIAVTCDQSRGEEQELSLQTKVMVVALGPVPPRRYSEGKSRRDAAMLLPQVGEVPPSKLYYQGLKDDVKNPKAVETWKPFQIAFNNTTAMRSIKAGEEFVLYRKLADGYEPYVTVPAGEVGMRRVVFLTPSSLSRNKNRPWMDKPHVTVISPDAGRLKDKHFVIKNLSRMTVLHAFGDTVANVDPGQLIGYRRNRQGVLYHLAARYGKQRKIIYNMAVKLGKGSGIHLYALYDAMPDTNAGRAVGVFRMVLPTADL